MFRRGRDWWHRLFRVCKCSSHVPLEGSLTTLAAAYPAGFCRAVGKLVQEFGPTTEGPWLGDLADTESGENNCAFLNKKCSNFRDQIGTRSNRTIQRSVKLNPCNTMTFWHKRSQTYLYLIVTVEVELIQYRDTPQTCRDDLTVNF